MPDTFTQALKIIQSNLHLKRIKAGNYGMCEIRQHHLSSTSSNGTMVYPLRWILEAVPSNRQKFCWIVETILSIEFLWKWSIGPPIRTVLLTTLLSTMPMCSLGHCLYDFFYKDITSGVSHIAVISSDSSLQFSPTNFHHHLLAYQIF